MIPVGDATDLLIEDEETRAKQEIYSAGIDARNAAASIDLDPAEAAEVDLEIEVNAATVHELTEDLNIETTDNPSELTSAEAPAAETPTEGSKAELFETPGIDLSPKDDERNGD